ncbi:MAG: xanthine dehydrogenase family protein molybdopterin-binding subunit [Sinobacteraceae bacterium]|nr:xanthine dehydrogenase family protein molybdopterin-binding subunit [Nevskiaceae bacterium]
MSPARGVLISRRAALHGGGALIVSCALPALPVLAKDAASGDEQGLPGSPSHAPLVDAWIRIDAQGAVTAFSGKAELGQGIRTALLQVVAEELEVPLAAVSLVTADTARTPDEGFTAGSHSMQDSGTALRHAAAQAREILLSEAARRMKVKLSELHAEAGAVLGPAGTRMPYGTLISDNLLHVRARPQTSLKDFASFSVMDRPVPRVDIPAKLTGGDAYVQDMRLPGMVHARVVRPPSYLATLAEVDVGSVEKMPAVLAVIRDGSFLAVIAEEEWACVKAQRALARAARWHEIPSLPDARQLHAALRTMSSQDELIFSRDEAPREPAQHEPRALAATYTRPYLAHGSIGPSCAIATFSEGLLTVWSHTQGVYPDRRAIAEMLHLPLARVRCIHVEGSGCYGHNGADDAAADAALLAMRMPGRPVRVQWMREQEHTWEPFGPAMLVDVRALLDSRGRIADWSYEVWSNTHAMRPGPAGALLAARYIEAAFPPMQPHPLPQPEGGGDRNAIPAYELPNARVMHHFLPQMPLRVSALRSLGAHMNVFAIESFIEELAAVAGTDPVMFRLQHLQDARAREVINAAAEEFRWAIRESPTHGNGYGFGFARYKNLAAYCAVAMHVRVDADSGTVRVLRVAAAVDTGQVVNPDGVRNQIEGGILQSLSWTLFERVTFDRTRITSCDWSGYPILRFDAVPESVSIRIVDRAGLPFLGCGEAAQGPAAAAVANAVANATGVRLRDLPLDPARIRAAVGLTRRE